MLRMFKRAELKLKVWVLVVAVIAGAAALMLPTSAEAHCDSMQGPVVSAAKKALETGDVKLILPYVKPEAEAELTAVFKQTLEVRKLGATAMEFADRHFFETAVRLHRTGEGAPYIGLKDEPVNEAIAAADTAMTTGSLDGVYTLLDKAIRDGVAEQYQTVKVDRERADKEGTVEANRERAEAELRFEKYVFGLHQSALGLGLHEEGE